MNDILLALDFDGVIWDSIQECFYVSQLAYNQLFGSITKNTGQLQRKFYQGRYLAKSGKDFYILLKLIDEYPDIDFSKMDFQKFFSYRTRYRQEVEQFTTRFYQIRNGLMNNQFDFWMTLHHPYPGIIPQIEKLQQKFPLVICSAKDKESIEVLLKQYELEFEIFSREITIYKPELMKRISQKKDVKLNQIFFIDDIMENLTAVREIGVNTFMAKWGYNNEIEQNKAMAQGIPLLELDSFAVQIEKMISKTIS